MGTRNVDCGFEKSLRGGKPFERPQPLRRGQGCGGGNYGRLPSVSAAGGRSSVPTQANPAPRPGIRSKSVSPSSSRPVTGSSVESECIQNSSKPRGLNQSQRAQSRSLCERPEQQPPTRPSSAGTSRLSSQPRVNTRDALKSREPQRGMASSQGAGPSSALCSGERRNEQTPIQNRTAMMSSKPGPSRIKSAPPGKRKVQFCGVPGTGSGPYPGLTSKLKDDGRVRQRTETRSGDERCQGGPESSPGPVYGPSLYPICPGQFDEPFVSLPGPRQVLLMPGDIDPNETTIIDIVGLDEGDIEEVPGIPLQTSSNLLEDAWNDYMRDAKENGRNRTMGQRSNASVRKPISGKGYGSSRGKISQTQGRTYPFEKYGNVTCPGVGGAQNIINDEDSCQRARPFGFGSRKTSVRPFTDDEKREIEEAQTYRAIRALINELDARWERDRAARGLTEDDLMDVDAEDCAPGNVEDVGRDIFQETDECDFGESYLPEPKVELSPVTPERRYRDLIMWDHSAATQAEDPCNVLDLLTGSSPQSGNRMPTSPNLMSMCEPDVDLLGLRTPPKSKQSSPTARRNCDDLIRWDSPQGSLPFDVPCEETFFDSVSRPSPESSRRRSSNLGSFPNGSPRRNSGLGASRQPLKCSSGKEPRVVRAIPLGDDPNLVVLEDSHLCRSGRRDMDPNISPGCHDLDQCSPATSSGYKGMSGIEPLDSDSDECSGFQPSLETNARGRGTSRIKGLFQPLTGGFESIENEPCPFDSDFEELERLCNEGMYENDRQTLGRLGAELVQQCPDPIEECADLLGLLEPPAPNPPRRTGPYARELIESCPEEQQLIDIDEVCPEPPTRSTQFNYSKDLFTNVQWEPSMAARKSNYPC